MNIIAYAQLRTQGKFLKKIRRMITLITVAHVANKAWRMEGERDKATTGKKHRYFY